MPTAVVAIPVPGYSIYVNNTRQFSVLQVDFSENSMAIYGSLSLSFYRTMGNRPRFGCYFRLMNTKGRIHNGEAIA